MPLSLRLLCSPPRCLMKMVTSPMTAMTSMAMNPAIFTNTLHRFNESLTVDKMVKAYMDIYQL